MTTDCASPTVQGVTGTVGTIAGTDRTLQATLGGRPPDTFAGDSGPSDVNGQGIGGWVVGPSGTKITKKAAPRSSSTGGGGYGGY